MRRSTLLAAVLAAGGGSKWEAVAAPHANFSWVPFTIQKKGATFRVDPTWTLASQITQTGGNRYVKKGGSDAKDGTSWANAWETLSYAIANVPANGVIYVDAGKYGWSDGGPENTAWGKTLSIIGVGTVIIDAYITCTWSLTAGKTSTYESSYTVGVPAAVLDYGSLDSDGAPAKLAAVASADLVESTANSYYGDDAGNKVYVHTSDGSAPSANIRPQYNGQSVCRIASSGRKGYLENIQAYCAKVDVANNSAAGGTAVYLKDCQLMHKSGTTMIELNGADAILQNCKWAHNGSAHDALAGFAANTVVCNIIEIDCEGWDIGVSGGADAFNATTNHNAGKNVIVNGSYYSCYGPNVGFINDGEAWILGTNSHDSLAAAGSNRSNYYLYCTLAYLDGCSGSNSTQDFLAGTGYTINVRNFTGAASVVGGGEVAAY